MSEVLHGSLFIRGSLTIIFSIGFLAKTSNGYFSLTTLLLCSVFYLLYIFIGAHILDILPPKTGDCRSRRPPHDLVADAETIRKAPNWWSSELGRTPR